MYKELFMYYSWLYIMAKKKLPLHFIAFSFHPGWLIFNSGQHGRIVRKPFGQWLSLDPPGQCESRGGEQQLRTRQRQRHRGNKRRQEPQQQRRIRQTQPYEVSKNSTKELRKCHKKEKYILRKWEKIFFSLNSKPNFYLFQWSYCCTEKVSQHKPKSHQNPGGH